MMDQTQWDKLFNAFDEEEPFWESKYASENDFDELNLFEWFECDSYGPSARMCKELSLHGYDVFPVEKDSFGWLIGGIRQMLDPSGKVITFG